MPSRPRTLPEPPPTFAPFPDWARPRRAHDGPGEHVDDAEFIAGAALASLNPIARSDHPLGNLWRQRLALASAEVVVKLEGRTEDAATLRDHLYLTRMNDDPGPAGRALQAWRILGAASGLRVARWEEDLPTHLQLAASPSVSEAIKLAAVRASTARGSPVAAAAEVSASALRLTSSRPLALWLADAVLARQLNWRIPVPMLAAHLKRSSLRFASGAQCEPDAWRAACAIGYARAAAAAFDQYMDLGRRATRLLEVAPKLRGKDADQAVLALLCEDALAAQAGATTSDRSSRRLFERLVELGAVRELTGRATFRLYGL